MAGFQLLGSYVSLLGESAKDVNIFLIEILKQLLMNYFSGKHKILL